MALHIPSRDRGSKKKRLIALGLEIIAGGNQTAPSIISNICEAFQCTPDVALEQDPLVVMAVLDYRTMHAAKDAFNKKATDMPESLSRKWAEVTQLMMDEGYLRS